MTGIIEVADRAGVSTATVSRALSGRGVVSDATRARVRRAADELGYVVSSSASGLATGRTRNVGVVIPFLNRWFFSTALEGAESALLSHGYDLTLYNLGGGGDDRRSVFEHFLLRKRVDAVVAICLELTGAEVDRLHAMNKPIVAVGGPIPGVRTLSIDDAAVARLATSHLIGLGHRVIAHIGGDATSETDFHIATSRRAGYEAALRDAGIAADPRFFMGADFSIQTGYHAAKQLLVGDGLRPTAIFAASDEMAFGAILAARDLGMRVPDDLSVVGIDGHELAEFFGLTTVEQHPADQGRMAVEVLMELLDGKRAGPDIDTPVPYTLVSRTSTGAPPAR